MPLPREDEPLPDDPRTLQAMVRELLEALASERRTSESLRTRLDQLLRRLYGPKSEKVSKTPSLFEEELSENEGSDNAMSLTTPQDPQPEVGNTPKKRRHGRRVSVRRKTGSSSCGAEVIPRHQLCSVMLEF